MNPVNKYIEENPNYIFTQCMRFLKNNTEASRDLSQQIILELWTKNNYKGSFKKYEIEGFLWGVIRNQIRILHNNKINTIQFNEIPDGDGFNYKIQDNMKCEIEFRDEFPRTFWEEELLKSGYTIDQAKLLLNIKSSLHKLNMFEKRLYELYFIERLSMKKIAIKVGLSTGTIFRMITSLKNKIRILSSKDDERKY